MQSQSDQVISKALEALGGSFDRIGPGQWGLALPGAGSEIVTARLAGSWLVIKGALDAGGKCMPVDQAAMWNYLARNAGLAGNAKYSIGDDGSVAAGAEIPLEGLPSEIVSLRIGEAVKGVIEARLEPPDQSAGVPSCDNGGDDSTRLTDLCANAGWPFIERSGDRLQVELDPAGCPQAVIERRSSGVAIRVDFIAEEGAYPEDNRASALGILLLRACGSLRMARAVTCRETPRGGVGFEVVFAGTPHPREVGQGLAALAVACELTWREVRALAGDAGLAQVYLRACSRRAARARRCRSES
jgi:hypothetical protein